MVQPAGNRMAAGRRRTELHQSTPSLRLRSGCRNHLCHLIDLLLFTDDPLLKDYLAENITSESYAKPPNTLALRSYPRTGQKGDMLKLPLTR